MWPHDTFWILCLWIVTQKYFYGWLWSWVSALWIQFVTNHSWMNIFINPIIDHGELQLSNSKKKKKICSLQICGYEINTQYSYGSVEIYIELLLCNGKLIAVDILMLQVSVSLDFFSCDSSPTRICLYFAQSFPLSMTSCCSFFIFLFMGHGIEKCFCVELHKLQ